MRRNAYWSGKFPIKFISVKARVKETYVHGLFPVEFFKTFVANNKRA